MYSTIRTTQSGVDILILLPDSYTGDPTPLVFYNHGASGDREALFTTYLVDVAETLLENGFIVAGISAGSQNWGNDSALSAYISAHSYLTSTYNIDQTVLVGQSMGGLSSLLTLANKSIPNISGWLGIYPVCDLENMYYTTFYGGLIDGAYGTGSYASIPAGHNPMTKTSSLFDVPMRFYASAGDTAVAKTPNSDSMATKVAAYAPEYEVVVCSGNHGDPSHFQPDDVLDFMQRVTDFFFKSSTGRRSGGGSTGRRSAKQ